MAFRYPLQSNNYVSRYAKALSSNQKNIVDVVSQYATTKLNDDNKKNIIDRVIFAAESSVAQIVYDGPNKTDRSWDAAFKSITKTSAALQNLNIMDFHFLDAELKQNDDTYDLLKYYSRFYRLPDDDVISIGYLHQHIIDSMYRFNNLLSRSLKGTDTGRTRERDDLKRYSFKLYGIFRQYTGEPLTLNGGFEKFAWQCLQPLQGVIKHSYTEESLKKSIRWLKKERGAEIERFC